MPAACYRRLTILFSIILIFYDGHLSSAALPHLDFILIPYRAQLATHTHTNTHYHAHALRTHDPRTRVICTFDPQHTTSQRVRKPPRVKLN